jgi:phage nucleotide-binding protein
LTFTVPDEATYANVLLYGPPKSGKTAAAASAPGTILYLNLDLPNATRFARGRAGDRMHEVQFEGLQTLVDIYAAVHQEPTFDTVVIDPIGDLYRRLLEEASDKSVRPTLNQYGDVGTHLERFCRSLCEAPINVVLIAHEFPVQDEASGEVEKLLWTGTKSSSAQMSNKLMGMVDIVGYTGILETEDAGKQYVAQLANAGGRRGGDRFDVLGDWRPLDLTEWFTLAGVHTGTTTKQEAAA